MKKIIIFIVPIVIFCSFSIYFCINIINARDKNEKLYKYFSDKELLDSGNKVNLDIIKENKERLESEIKEISPEDNLDISEIIAQIDHIKSENEEKNSEIETLSNELNNLNDKVSSLEAQYNSLSKKYNNLVWEEKQRKIRESTIKIEGVPTINQYPSYPTGCESVALTILLRYYGINVSPNNIIDNLKKGELPHDEGGVMYGGNPEIEFIGNPYSNEAYGVYETPIGNVANMYKQDANTRSNFPFSEVLNLVKNNRPVVVWTSSGLAVPYISRTWTYKPTMEKISWKSHEHAVVVIGYNDNEIIISDPMGGSIKYQNRNTFESRYNYYGKKAIYY